MVVCWVFLNLQVIVNSQYIFNGDNVYSLVLFKMQVWKTQGGMVWYVAFYSEVSEIVNKRGPGSK